MEGVSSSRRSSRKRGGSTTRELPILDGSLLLHNVLSSRYLIYRMDSSTEVRNSRFNGSIIQLFPFNRDFDVLNLCIEFNE